MHKENVKQTHKHNTDAVCVNKRKNTNTNAVCVAWRLVYFDCAFDTYCMRKFVCMYTFNCWNVGIAVFFIRWFTLRYMLAVYARDNVVFILFFHTKKNSI